jgi:hypothetical protein
VTDPISSVPIKRILDGLARIHRWILVMDAQRRIIWMSDALRELSALPSSGSGSMRGTSSQAPEAGADLPDPFGHARAEPAHRSAVDLLLADGRSIPVVHPTSSASNQPTRT